MVQNRKGKVSVAVIGEGETEWFYIDALRVGMRYPFRMVPDFAQHSDIPHITKLIQKCLNQGFDYIVVLVDMDRLLACESEMAKYVRMRQSFVARRKTTSHVLILETNPCTEFWFLLHFLPTPILKRYESQNDVIAELRRYMPGYEKTERYFTRNNLFRLLVESGGLQRALANSEKIERLAAESESDSHAYSQINQLFRLLERLT
jgi:hypothetical protein